MMLSGIAFTFLHLGLVKALTRDDQWPAARRMFVGWRFAIQVLVVIVTSTFLLGVLFQKDFGDKEARKTLFGILLVWVPSWVIHLALLRIYSKDLYQPRRAEIALEEPED
jgi:hypothetical protein